MPIVTANPVLDTVDHPIAIYYFDRVSAIFKGVGSPEGVTFAGEGSIAVNASGQAFIKTTPFTVNTGWTPIQTGTPAPSPVQVLTSQTSVVANVGAGLDQLHVFQLSAGALAADGDWFDWESGGFLADNANSKRLVFRIDETTPFTLFDLTDVWTNLTWRFRARVVRTGTNSVRATVSLVLNQVSDGTQVFTFGGVFDHVFTGSLGSTNVFPNTLGQSLAATSGDVQEELFEAVLFV